MYGLAHVTNTLLKQANDLNMPLTPMKLQKMLYFTYKAYLKLTKEPLFSERFQPWQYGPVLSDVYYTFQEYRSHPIRRYYPDSSDGECRYIRRETDVNFAKAFNDTWTRYAGLSGIELSNFTHKPDSAWTKTVKRGSSVIEDTDILEEPEY